MAQLLGFFAGVEVVMENKVPEIMTIGETANYLRISSSSLYKLAQGGRIPCQKVGRHWRFRREALDRWLEQIDTHQDTVRVNKNRT
jgi:excisionase family DNA binding protein